MHFEYSYDDMTEESSYWVLHSNTTIPYVIIDVLFHWLFGYMSGMKGIQNINNNIMKQSWIRKYLQDVSFRGFTYEQQCTLTKDLWQVSYDDLGS